MADAHAIDAGLLACIALFSGYAAWAGRSRLPSLAWRGGAAGAAAAGLAVALGLTGVAVSSTTLAVLAIPAGALATALLAFGHAGARTLAFPIGFLLLLVPLPEVVASRLSLLAQHLAAGTAEAALHALGIPVLRDGLALEIGVVTVLIAPECDGLRFLFVAVAAGLALAWATARPRGQAAVIVGAAALTGIAGNLARVTGTAILAWSAPAAVAGTPHLVFGKLVYLAVAGLFAAALLIALRRDRPMTRTGATHRGVAGRRSTAPGVAATPPRPGR